MKNNPVIEMLMARASTREFRDEVPAQEVIEAIVRAGQQAPFAMQMCSVILEREGEIPWKAPLCFIICADAHRLIKIAKLRGWENRTCGLGLWIFAIQDAAYMAQNMVVAAEALGLGSCYIGSAPFMAAEIAEKYDLPPKVFPLVMLVVGYPAKRPVPRPRYPLWFTLFEKRYPRFTEEQLREAMRVMDEGYLAQNYYRGAGLKLPVGEGREDRYTYDDYSWTEHMSRKLQWIPTPDELLESLRRCGFDLMAPSAGVDEGKTDDVSE